MKNESPLGSDHDDPVVVPAKTFALAPEAMLATPTEFGRVRKELAGCAGKSVLALAHGVRCLLKKPADLALAQALAELAVTGRRAYEQFAALEAAGKTEASVLALMGESPSPLAKKCVADLVTRARNVRAWIDSKPGAPRRDAWAALHGGAAPAARPWLCTSGEDDLPLHPINLSRTEQVEERLAVTTSTWGKITTSVRWAHSANVATADHVILFLHGLGSRLEETEELSRCLGESNIGTIALDLPNHGYSDRIPFDALSIDMGTTGAGAKGPFYGLKILEAFVDAFGATLIEQRPDLKLAGRLTAVGGGSLGGSLALRLAARKPKWLTRGVAWSPGNAWMSFWQEPGNGGDAHNDEHRLAIDPFIAHGLGSTIPIDRVRMKETSGSRHDYIDSVFQSKLPPWVHVQWEMWWRDGDFAAARDVHRLDSVALRQEVYDEWHRRWCSALAHEQIASSMRGPMNEGAPGEWAFDHLQVPVLLMAGDHDDYPFAHIFTASNTLAKRGEKLGKPRGRARFFENTGHSIHDERPRRLAKNIDQFLRLADAEL